MQRQRALSEELLTHILGPHVAKGRERDHSDHYKVTARSQLKSLVLYSSPPLLLSHQETQHSGSNEQADLFLQHEDSAS